RCGATGLRPTFGRVPRTGAMALSWTMDKLGPIARTVQDAAIVLAAIQGPDDQDPTCREAPFAAAAPVDVRGWKVGFVEKDFERSPEDKSVLDELKALGVELVPVELPPQSVSAGDLLVILTSEAASTRRWSGRTRRRGRTRSARRASSPPSSTSARAASARSSRARWTRSSG